jgi:hypothetical protein
MDTGTPRRRDSGRRKRVVEVRAAILRTGKRDGTGAAKQRLTGLNQVTGTTRRGEEGSAILGEAGGGWGGQGLGRGGEGKAGEGRQIRGAWRRERKRREEKERDERRAQLKIGGACGGAGLEEAVHTADRC